MTLGFQHIKHDYTDFECIYNNSENPFSDYNTKRHIFDLCSGSQCWYFSHEPASLFQHSALVDLSVSMMMH